MRFFAIAMRPALALLVTSMALQALGQPVALVGLLVNGVSNPLAIDRDACYYVHVASDDRTPTGEPPESRISDTCGLQRRAFGWGEC